MPTRVYPIKRSSSIKNEDDDHTPWLNSEGGAFNTIIAAKLVHCIDLDTSKSLKANLCLRERNADALPKFEIDELSIGKLVGQGGFAQVSELRSIKCRNTLLNAALPDARRLYLASQAQKLNKVGDYPFVVKHLRPRFLWNPLAFRVAATDLIMEAHFLASIQHPHIISIHAIASGGPFAYANGHTNGFFILLERVVSTLRDRINQWSKQLHQFKITALEKIYGEAGVDCVLYVGRLLMIRDIASAIAYLHNRRIIYRDLKPENVGIDANGKVKLLDFGLACEFTLNQIDRQRRVGSPRYMAPESFLGQAYDEKVDVYALAIVLWEILALKKCFPDLCMNAFKERVIEQGERPEINMIWPHGIRLLLQRGWSAVVHERPRMQEFQDNILLELNQLKAWRGDIEQIVDH